MCVQSRSSICRIYSRGGLEALLFACVGLPDRHGSVHKCPLERHLSGSARASLPPVKHGVGATLTGADLARELLQSSPEALERR
jgi:hypothetical protein